MCVCGRGGGWGDLGGRKEAAVLFQAGGIFSVYPRGINARREQMDGKEMRLHSPLPAFRLLFCHFIPEAYSHCSTPHLEGHPHPRISVQHSAQYTGSALCSSTATIRLAG